MRYVAAICCFAQFMLFTNEVLAIGEGELGYVSDGELKSEIAERENDIKRTKARLAELLTLEQKSSAELAAARSSIIEIETQTQVRVRAYYCMSRNAGTLRFLFDAVSPTDAIRRITLLRRLLIEGLEARRAAGLRIAEAERTASRVIEDKEAAGLMLDMLNEALQSRIKEATDRHISLPGIRAHR